jgi:hypothetical protein
MIVVSFLEKYLKELKKGFPEVWVRYVPEFMAIEVHIRSPLSEGKYSEVRQSVSLSTLQTLQEGYIPSMVESVKRAFEREKLIEERSQRPALVRILEDPFGGHLLRKF